MNQINIMNWVLTVRNNMRKLASGDDLVETIIMTVENFSQFEHADECLEATKTTAKINHLFLSDFEITQLNLDNLEVYEETMHGTNTTRYTPAKNRHADTALNPEEIDQNTSTL